MDINEYFERQEIINNQLIVSNKNITDIVKSLKEQSIDVISQNIGEIIKNYKAIENEINLIKKENEEKAKKIKVLDDDIALVKEKTNTLEFEDSAKLGEIKKVAKQRVIHFIGTPHEPKYILFFRPYIVNLYSVLSNNLVGGKRIGKIKPEDFEVAKTLARRWTPSSNLIDRLIADYVKSKSLSEEKKKALDLYLDEINGGKNN